MAIYGVGAYFEWDVSFDFKKFNVIGTGWDLKIAPDLHEFFKLLNTGDIVYLKSAPIGSAVRVKGIGLVSSEKIINGRFGTTNIEIGREIQWLNKTVFKLDPMNGKNNVKSNTIYLETHPDVIKIIMDIVDIEIKQL